jgi:protein LTV1
VTRGAQIEAEYLDDEDESSFDEDEPDEQDFTLFDPTAKREDLDSMMDDFLSRFEIVGNKLRPKLEGATPQAKVDTIRRELLGTGENGVATISDTLADEEKARIRAMAAAILRRQARKTDAPEYAPVEHYSDRYDRWDCETILSASGCPLMAQDHSPDACTGTYSNLENHPRLLSARGFVHRPEPRIRLDPKTGVPSVVDNVSAATKRRTAAEAMPAQDETVAPRGGRSHCRHGHRC